MATSIKYRKDIDGLRAIAVLGVIAFHLDAGLLPGGFSGVDMFFVISGYLITSIISREVGEGRFSFRNFYLRRIRRIAPAYIAVTLSTLVAGTALMMPDDLRDLSISAIWSAFSLPNVYFWKHLDTSYFAPSSDQIPLLHLWSLGVEEQFYLIWPALLVLMTRLSGRAITIVMTVAIAIGSFSLAESSLASDPKFAYYMLPARAGELMIGAVLALFARARTESVADRRWWFVAASESSAIVGYGLIAYSLLKLDSESGFPGWNALYPCLGAALLILAGMRRDPVVSFPLRTRPMVWIGLISYSLYLWHWPVLAMTRYFAVSIDLWLAVACLLAMFVLAVISYRFVEVPFRRPGSGAGSRWFGPPLAYTLATVTVVSLCLVLKSDWLHQTLPGRAKYAAALAAMDNRTRAALDFDYNCQRSRLDKGLFKNELCVIRPESRPDAPIRAMLVGDSNAAHYLGVIGALGNELGFAFRNVTLSSCPPLFGHANAYGRSSDLRGCTRYRNAVRQEVGKYDYVFLGAQWSSHSRRPGFERDLERTLRELSRNGKKVVLLAQAPRFRAYDRRCELRRLKLPLIDCKARAEARAMVDRKVNALLKSQARRLPNVHYFDVEKVICPGGKCSPYLDGEPIYYDPGHISMTGSWEIGRRLARDAAFSAAGFPSRAAGSSSGRANE